MLGVSDDCETSPKLEGIFDSEDFPTSEESEIGSNNQRWNKDNEELTLTSSCFFNLFPFPGTTS